MLVVAPVQSRDTEVGLGKVFPGAEFPLYLNGLEKIPQRLGVKSLPSKDLPNGVMRFSRAVLVAQLPTQVQRLLVVFQRLGKISLVVPTQRQVIIPQRFSLGILRCAGYFHRRFCGGDGLVVKTIPYQIQTGFVEFCDQRLVRRS